MLIPRRARFLRDEGEDPFNHPPPAAKFLCGPLNYGAMSAR